MDCTGCGDGSDKADGQVGGHPDPHHDLPWVMVYWYADLRMDKNLDEDKDLVKYFSQVIKKRLETE